MVLFYLNSSMKWIMVIFLCFGQDCTTLIGDQYTDPAKCQTESQMHMEMLQMQYPMSSGQIYCLDEATFKDWLGVKDTSA